jgi:hypothetical protein
MLEVFILFMSLGWFLLAIYDNWAEKEIEKYKKPRSWLDVDTKSSPLKKH